MPAPSCAPGSFVGVGHVSVQFGFLRAWVWASAERGGWLWIKSVRLSSLGICANLFGLGVPRKGLVFVAGHMVWSHAVVISCSWVIFLKRFIHPGNSLTNTKGGKMTGVNFGHYIMPVSACWV